jgi:DNA-binding CsgD family transcriptional regulator
MGIGRAGFVADHELFGDDEFLADPLMTHWGDPVGLHRTAATAIRMPTGDFVVVHVQRRKGLPKLDEGDLARLNAFRPHLARAGMLAARWRMQRLQAAAEALALVGLPAAVLDFNGRVLAANDLLEDKSSWLAWLPGDRLALLDLPANNLLTRALTELRDPVMASVRSIPIRAKGGASAAVVHLVPVTGRARDIFDGAYGILVMTPCSTTTSPVDGILEALFDLTPAEAKVASRIADGLSLDQIAVQHHVAIDTIRAQCKAVFAKTGTNRQAQVASLLAGIPRLPRGRSSG